MIQRIQSIYLLFAFFLQTVGAIYAPHLRYENYDWLHAIAYHFISAGLALLLLVCLVFFKRRLRQLFLCRLCMGFLFIVIGLQLYPLTFEKFSFERDLLLGTDLVSFLFIYLAYRAIKKDETLVRSIDRIR